jgi:hypothetical protein
MEYLSIFIDNFFIISFYVFVAMTFLVLLKFLVNLIINFIIKNNYHNFYTTLTTIDDNRLEKVRSSLETKNKDELKHFLVLNEIEFRKNTEN